MMPRPIDPSRDLLLRWLALLAYEARAALRASVRRHRRAQGGSPMLRSIGPTRATHRFGTSVEPLPKPRRDRLADQWVWDALSASGSLWFCWRVPRIIGLTKRSSLHNRPVALRHAASSGWSCRSRIAMNASRTPSNRMGAGRWGRLVLRSALASGRVGRVARGGFRRRRPPKHGAQGRLAQRLAQR